LVVAIYVWDFPRAGSQRCGKAR